MNTIVVEAGKKPKFLNFKELFEYRELLYVLTYRDFRAKYAQSVLGLTWGFIKPMAQLLVVTFIFGRVVKIDTGGIPYPVFALSGIVTWAYFAAIISNAGRSVIGAQRIIKKVYFPRLIFPLSKVLVSFVDFGITLVFLIILMLIFRVEFSLKLLWVFPLILWVMVVGAGVGVWLSALTIRFRDFLHITPVITQLGYYVSPIVYPSSLLAKQFPELLPFYYLNPMAGLIEMFRWATVHAPFPPNYAWLSLVVSFILFFSGIAYFNQMSRKMADIL